MGIHQTHTAMTRAQPLKRLFKINIEIGSEGKLKVIAFIADHAVIKKVI
jgi:hypothetical protein